MCLYSTSPLRRAIHTNNLDEIRDILDSSGPSAADMINEDFTSDCLFNPFLRNVRPCLQSALNRGNVDVIRMLLDYGADPDIPGPNGERAVHMASRYRSTQILLLLHEYKADIHVQDSYGNYPVHTAINPVLLTNAGIHGKVESMQCLLEQVGKESDANLTNTNGQTPLHLAASVGNVAVTEYLLAVGVDPTIQDNNGKIPEQVADSSVIHLFKK